VNHERLSPRQDGPRRWIELFAAIRRDGRAGMSVRTMAGEHRVSRRTVRAATPPPAPAPWSRFCCCTGTCPTSTSSPGWPPRCRPGHSPRTPSRCRPASSPRPTNTHFPVERRVRPASNVVSLTERRLAQLPQTPTRPLPTVTAYDQLLRRSERRIKSALHRRAGLPGARQTWRRIAVPSLDRARRKASVAIASTDAGLNPGIHAERSEDKNAA